MLVTSTNVDGNFWEVNSPELKYTKPFSDYYKKDRSKDKHFSSKQMWAAFMFCDPRSKKHRLDDEEKKEEIIEYFLTPKHKWSDLDIIIDAWPNVCLTKVQRLFRGWVDKLTERDEFIRTTPYNQSSYEMLDKMMAQTKRMWDHLGEVRDNMIEEENKSDVFGGRQETLAEQGIL